MTHPRRISLCFAAIALTALSACSQSSAADEALVFDASSTAKFETSIARLSAALSEEQQLALTKAVGALEAYPMDGNCEINNVLAHIQKQADPAFRQKIRLRRFHGLTADQIIDLAKDKNCNAALGLSEDAINGEMPK